jgi:hypothetical protein
MRAPPLSFFSTSGSTATLARVSVSLLMSNYNQTFITMSFFYKHRYLYMYEHSHLYEYIYAHITPMNIFEKLSRLDLKIHEVDHQ